MLSLRILAGRHLPVRSMTLCFVGRRPRRMLFWKAAENKLLRELVGSKQTGCGGQQTGCGGEDGGSCEEDGGAAGQHTARAAAHCSRVSSRPNL